MLMVQCQCGCGVWLRTKNAEPQSKYAGGHKPRRERKKETSEDEAPRDVLWTQ